MYLFKSQSTRKRLHINWAQEYVLGLVRTHPNCHTSEITQKATEAMSGNTAYKYVTQLVERGLIEQTVDRYDRRFTTLAISETGKDVINEIEQSGLEHTNE